MRGAYHSISTGYQAHGAFLDFAINGLVTIPTLAYLLELRILARIKHLQKEIYKVVRQGLDVELWVRNFPL